MFDTDYFIQRIVESGTPENQARAIVRSIVDAQDDLANKRDLKEAMNELKAEIKLNMADIKHDIALNEKTTSLKFTGLYLLIFAIASGVAKLVFWGST